MRLIFFSRIFKGLLTWAAAFVTLSLVAAAVLSGRCIRPGVFEFELFHFNRSLWRCVYELKK